VEQEALEVACDAFADAFTQAFEESYSQRRSSLTRSAAASSKIARWFAICSLGRRPRAASPRTVRGPRKFLITLPLAFCSGHRARALAEHRKRASECLNGFAGVGGRRGYCPKQGCSSGTFVPRAPSAAAGV
jgi:hypothetical protein